MSIDTDVLIIGAGMSGLGVAIQLIRNFSFASFELIEKEDDVGGTWKANTYPACGCDVASHFYSFSFALNPDWSQKFSMRSEIQAYFRNVAEQYNLIPRIQFRSTVETARWNEPEQLWEVTIKHEQIKQTLTKRCRILVSGVGSLSIPKQCDIPGASTFQGTLFHSARWNHDFDWAGKNVIVLGNGCSATQFVPAMSQTAGSITQFARSPQFLAERPNPQYSAAFKAFMRHMPLAMRLYRFKLYAEMEKDFAGFDIESGARIRQGLKDENKRYVKRMAPERYWDALIPNYEIGCKRKVMDTDYLSCLHKQNVDLVHDDSVVEIKEHGVLTKGGRFINADAIILATGFQVARMLWPMQIFGEGGISLNDLWNNNYSGAPQAYLGTSYPGVKNFFNLMGPNTVTGHLSVIYTVECQISYVLRLIKPILESAQPQRSLWPSKLFTSVDVTYRAAIRESDWLQAKLKTLVWASGCTSWALDPKTGLNVAMWPQYQFMFWLRSIFISGEDFDYQYRDASGLRKEKLTIGGYKILRRMFLMAAALSALAGGILGMRRLGDFLRLREAGRVSLRKMAAQALQAIRW